LVLPQASGESFTVTAKADRIDWLADGSLAIIDYKTGTPPSAKEVERGVAAQLPLEAVMAGRGGFAGVASAPVSALEHWWLSGRREGGEIRGLRDPEQQATAAELGLLRLIETFEDEATPYHSQPVAGSAPRFSDYAHLARVKEWATAGADEDEF
jgi:ATP-dependent helicase/nuclease subunit B